MRLKLFSLGFFFLFLAGFSQTENLVSGRILSEGAPLKNIDVINMATKRLTLTNSDGYFTILAKADDELFIISKNHVDRKIILTESDFETNSLTVDLSVKPIELEEVTVYQKPLGGYKVSQADMDLVKLEKQLSRPVNTSVYTGEMVNGMDFIRIGEEIINLFKKKDGDKKPVPPPIVFRDYVNGHFQEDFYTKTLGLKQDQIFIFIEFCDADPNSHNVAQKNEMAVMDFLIAKSREFKKL